MQTPTALAVFASERGPGDAERSSIMTQAGTFFAKRGARIICPAHAGGLCVPLIKSAQAAGGDVQVIAETGFKMPAALSGIPVERFRTKGERQKRIGALADAFVGLPGSLGSATCLYETWVGLGGTKPVGLLNRNRAFEVLRGFAVDVLSHSVRDWERRLQFAESLDDLWNRINRALASS